MSEGRQMKDRNDVLAFMQAGAAKFTLKSVKTGGRFTYRIKESNDGKVFFVSLLTGTNNENDYSYMGVIGAGGEFRRTAKSRVTEESLGYQAFNWFWRQIASGSGSPLNPVVEFWHEGCCGRCGRALTVPESIERGIGPECWKMTKHVDDEVQLELTGGM